MGGNARFCQNCGLSQPNAQGPGEAEFTDFLDGLSDRTASILCYIPVFGVIPAIVFLAARKYRLNSRVRFDAFQALYLFVAWLIISSAIPTLLFAGVPPWGIESGVLGLIKLAIFGCWIYLLVKAAQQQQIRLPIIGDLAARSTTEQL